MRLTADEIVEILRRTSLPTVLVEGTTDAYVYRLLEDQVGAGWLFLPCGGRKTLLDVFERRAAFAGQRVAFVADRDMWLFTSIPSQYNGVVFTAGYSIENDVLDGESIERLFDASERQTFSILLAEIAKWFAFEVESFRAGNEPRVAAHIDRILPLNSVSLCPDFCRACGYCPPADATHRDVVANYRIRLRGKHLLDLLHRILSAPTRRSKFSKMNLLEIAAKSGEHHGLEALCECLRSQLFA